jgi:hypothetical protein
MQCLVEANTHYNVTYTKYVTAYLYAVFIAVVFALPAQVQFGESLCFAYIFSLLQMTTLPLFHGNFIYLAVATLSATVLPSLQIVLAIDYGYDLYGMAAFSTAYMIVQVSLYLLLRFSIIFRPRSIKQSEEGIAIASVLLWLVTGLLLVFALIDPSESSETIDKYVYMVHYTTIFVLSVVNSRMRV